MNSRDTPPQINNPIDAKAQRINQAREAIAALTRVQARIARTGRLHAHIEWAKESLWADAYPGSAFDTLLDGLQAEAENAG